MKITLLGIEIDGIEKTDKQYRFIDRRRKPKNVKKTVRWRDKIQRNVFVQLIEFLERFKKEGINPLDYETPILKEVISKHLGKDTSTVYDYLYTIMTIVNLTYECWGSSEKAKSLFNFLLEQQKKK